MLPSTNEQPEHIERVSARIGRSIVSFCRDRLVHTTERLFTMQELVDAVHAACGVVAPDSPSRILRYLKAQGVVRYDLVSRRASLYRIKAVVS
jgi:hypothetical protein